MTEDGGESVVRVEKRTSEGKGGRKGRGIQKQGGKTGFDRESSKVRDSRKKETV